METTSNPYALRNMLYSMGACIRGSYWADNYSTLERAWAECEEPEWLVWFLWKLDAPHPDQKWNWHAQRSVELEDDDVDMSGERRICCSSCAAPKVHNRLVGRVVDDRLVVDGGDEYIGLDYKRAMSDAIREIYPLPCVRELIRAHVTFNRYADIP